MRSGCGFSKGMYDIYNSYKETLFNSKRTLRKRQKMNADIRDKYPEPFKRKDHSDNVRDITAWNSMISEMEESMRMMEMYLDFDDRVLLHRDYNNMKSMILNQNSYEGEVFLDGTCEVSVPSVEEAICCVELQEEIVELIGRVLSERQVKIVYMYYWKDMTQKEIGDEMGMAQKNVSVNLQNSLKLLEKCIDYDEIRDFLSF